MTLIMGIDPGSRKTGFGIVATSKSKASYITSGVIRLPVDQPLAPRLSVLFTELNELIDRFQPEEVAIEEVFMARSAGSALKLGQARGAAMVACVNRGLVVHEYSARSIKQAVVGTGAATKEQVQHMVKTLLLLPGSPAEDAADGLAAALCHAHSRAGLGMLKASAMRRGRLR